MRRTCLVICPEEVSYQNRVAQLAQYSRRLESLMAFMMFGDRRFGLEHAGHRAGGVGGGGWAGEWITGDIHVYRGHVFVTHPTRLIGTSHIDCHSKTVTTPKREHRSECAEAAQREGRAHESFSVIL